MRRLNQHGDTIVEVLISMVVVSAVLSGAFASASRSLSATQAAKERDQGVRLAESQVEQLKSAITDPAQQAIFTDNDDFCMNSNVRTEQNGNISSDVGADVFSTLIYANNCILNSGNNTYIVGDSSIPYYVSIAREDATDTNLFTTRVRWERAGGGGREEVRLIYRVYQ